MSDTVNEADLLYGVDGIGKYLPMLRERQIRHLIDKGVIPTFKIGDKVCARRSKIDAYIRELERKAEIEARRKAGDADAA